MSDDSVGTRGATGGTPSTAAIAVAGFLILIVSEALIGQLVQTAVLRWLPQLLAAIILLATVWLYWRGGRFNRNELTKAARWERIAARSGSALLTLVYLALTISVQTSGFWPTLATAASLSGGAALALREVLSPRPAIGTTVVALAILLFGVAALQVGFAAFQFEWVLGISLLILAATFLLLAMRLLNGRSALSGYALILGGLSCFSFGMTELFSGSTLSTGIFLFGLAIIGLGIAVMRDDPVLASIACMACGAVLLLAAVTGPREGPIWPRVTVLLLGIAFLLASLAVLRSKSIFGRTNSTLAAIAILLPCVGGIQLGFAVLQGGLTIFGITLLALCIAAFVLSTSALWPTGSFRRRWVHLRNYLTERPGISPPVGMHKGR
ncbi:hypothetical protein [Promicromonospora iranensis]|uniref:EamA-like transporter family protein n=1 Tax=Promicromonospora iranensis TaxID=1105144 RepID=A0ABU2CV02_9MICO|nr:hypothetical protein [Promicromonospora iranensis]MDR7385138.1 hypothetical protein [Promicromonospora iranensis]